MLNDYLDHTDREEDWIQGFRSSSIDFGIYLHTIFHSVFTFTVQSPQNLRSNPYNKKLENGSYKFFFRYLPSR